MELLVIMFIVFVVSKLFGGIVKQLPQDQRRTVGRPFPNIPSEWNFPRPATVDMEPAPAEEPTSTKSVIFYSQEKELRKTEVQSAGLKTASESLTGQPNPQLALNNNSVSQFGESPLENLLVPENLISGIILAELLQPPKSKRGAR